MVNNCPQPKYPAPVGQLLNDNILVQKHFDTEVFRNFFLGTYHDQDNARWVFIKMKHNLYPNEIEAQRWEYKIYKTLENMKGISRIARPLFFGPILCYEALVLELLGPNLYNLWIRCERRLSIRALAQLGYQLVCLMKYFHDRGLVYQNVRLEHFVYGASGRGKWTWLYAVDLKWCKFWCYNNNNDNNNNSIHIPYHKTDNGPVQIGTHIRFMSINAHKGVEQTRRDDLESIGYLLVYLFRGDLPWIKFENLPNIQERHQRIAECKEKSLSYLCQNMLPEFERYMRMVRSLNFEQKPDYQTLGQLFRDVQQLIGYNSVYELYDWNYMHHPKMKM